MTDLRYIDMGKIDSSLLQALFEVPDILDVSNPILIQSMPNKTNIVMCNLLKPEVLLHTENIPKDVDIMRVYDNSDNARGVAYMPQDEHLTYFLCVPMGTKDIVNNLTVASCRALRKHNVNMFTKGNDLLLLESNVPKKCAGSAHNFNFTNGCTFAVSFGLTVPQKLINDTIRFDSFKFANKPAITDIRQITCGLKDYKPKLTLDFATDIAIELASLYGWNYKPDSFTVDELDLINQRDVLLNTTDWRLNGVR